jgi:predicted anti-sigma-YlaC factor YlaD
MSVALSFSNSFAMSISPAKALRTTHTRRGGSLLPALLLLVAVNTGCLMKRIAVNKIGDAIASGGTVYASDNDPELVREAVPFSLKLVESLVAESPRHRGLLLAACKGFTEYSYAFVQENADELEPIDFASAERTYARARRLYLRARDYGLRGLEVHHRGFGNALRTNPKSAARRIVSKKEVPLLYWTAAAWGLAISISKDHPDLIADQPSVEALIDRAHALDEGFEQGAIESFLISYEPSRQGAEGDPYARSCQHFKRALALSHGELAGPYVALAEAVSIQKQNRAEFESLLHRALKVDPDAHPEFRMENLISQRRARWLLSRADDLFAPKTSSDRR